MARTLVKSKHAWKNSLVATTGLSLFAFISGQLWAAGLQEWAFLLIFLAVWILISISWSNVNYAEESGTILARIVDHNFEGMSEKIRQLEQDLAELKGSSIEEKPQTPER